jgi:hypothetical protein
VLKKIELRAWNKSRRLLLHLIGESSWTSGGAAVVCVPWIWSLKFRWVILLLPVFLGGVVLFGVDFRSFL